MFRLDLWGLLLRLHLRFLVLRMFHLAQLDLVLRWHLLFRMGQQYLVHPKFPKDRSHLWGLWVHLHRTALPFRMVRGHHLRPLCLEHHSFPKVP